MLPPSPVFDDPARTSEWLKTHWRDLVTAFEILLTIIGFAITVVQIRKSRGAAEAARDAAQRAQENYTRNNSLTSIASAIEMIEEVKRHHRTESWSMALDRYGATARLLITIREQAPLSKAQRTAITASIEQLQTMEETVTIAERDGVTPQTTELNKILSKQIERLQVLLEGARKEGMADS
jgi:Co/Zn/Cd efflux system component